MKPLFRIWLVLLHVLLVSVTVAWALVTAQPHTWREPLQTSCTTNQPSTASVQPRAPTDRPRVSAAEPAKALQSLEPLGVGEPHGRFIPLRIFGATQPDPALPRYSPSSDAVVRFSAVGDDWSKALLQVVLARLRAHGVEAAMGWTSVTTGEAAVRQQVTHEFGVTLTTVPVFINTDLQWQRDALRRPRAVQVAWCLMLERDDLAQQGANFQRPDPALLQWRPVVLRCLPDAEGRLSKDLAVLIDFLLSHEGQIVLAAHGLTMLTSAECRAAKVAAQGE